MQNGIWKKILLLLRIIFGMFTVLGLVMILPLLGGIRTYAVLSGSMEPAIHTGSIVFVDSNDRTPEKGDVITYQIGELKVTHRVKEIYENGYETAGDANKLSDGELVSREQILGCVCFSIPYLGYLVLYMRSAQGIFICFFLILMYAFIKCLIEI